MHDVTANFVASDGRHIKIQKVLGTFFIDFACAGPGG